MIPKLQGRIRIRAVLWGILGLGVASAVLIVWTNKKSVIRYNAGKRSLLHLAMAIRCRVDA